MTLQDKVQALLDAACKDQNKIPGAAIWIGDRSGETLVNAVAGVREVGTDQKLTAADVFRMFSVTKLVTAVAAMQLIERGQIDPDAKLGQIVPDMPGANECTLRMLLTHTGGHAYSSFHPQVYEAFVERGQSVSDGSLKSIQGPLVNVPGESWEYGLGLDWAGRVIEKVTVKSLEDYFCEHIFKPLGIQGMTFYPSKLKAPLTTMHIKQDGLVVPIPDFMPQEENFEILYAGAGLYCSSSESFGQLLCTLLNSGTHPRTHKQILKPESVHELFRDQLTEEQAARMYRPLHGYPSYISNTFILHEGLRKNWSYAGCKSPDGLSTGRSGSSVWWGGFSNSYWYCDLEDGTCAYIQSHTLPFFDEDVVRLFFMDIEPLIHQAAKA